MYDLYGYIFHKGENTFRGHYVSIVKTECSAPYKKGKWIACDDSKIQELTDKEENWFRKRAYVFLYQQRVKLSTLQAPLTHLEFEQHLSSYFPGEELQEDLPGQAPVIRAERQMVQQMSQLNLFENSES